MDTKINLQQALWSGYDLLASETAGLGALLVRAGVASIGATWSGATVAGAHSVGWLEVLALTTTYWAANFGWSLCLNLVSCRPKRVS